MEKENLISTFSQTDLEVQKLLFEEWKYRLNQLWSLMIKSTFSILALTFLPYLNILKVSDLGIPHFVFPVTGLFVSILTGFFSTIEIYKINKIKDVLKRNIRDYARLFSDAATKSQMFHQNIPIALFSFLSLLAIFCIFIST